MTRYLALVFEADDDFFDTDADLLAAGEEAARWLELDGCYYSEVVLRHAATTSPFSNPT